MSEKQHSKVDLRLARLCKSCPVCRHARKKQRGVIYQSVKHVESKICPACRAYERVYGRKSHEGSSDAGDVRSVEDS